MTLVESSLSVFYNMTSEESVTSRKDWMTTRNRLVTTGETVDIQERLELGIKGRHAKMMTP